MPKNIKKTEDKIKYELRPSCTCMKVKEKELTSYDVIEDNREIVKIKQITREDKKTYWYFADETKTSINSDFGERIVFPTKDLAYEFIVAFRKNMKRHVEERPLPDDVMDFIQQKARLLYDRKKLLISELYDVQSERHSLLTIARKYNVHEVECVLANADGNKIVKDLLEFKYEENPFFSEETLYELIGKNDARTLLALISALVEYVEPGGSINL